MNNIITEHSTQDQLDYFYNSNVYKSTHKINFKTEFTDIPCYNFFLTMIKKYKFILAGGFVFNKIVNYEIPNKNNSDIDIFFYNTNKHSFLEFINNFMNYVIYELKNDVKLNSRLYEQHQQHDSLYNEFSIIEITINNINQKFQFMNKLIMNSPEEIINSFNIDYVKVYYDFNKEKLNYSKKALVAYENWACPISLRSVLNIKSMNKGMRVYKQKPLIDLKQFYSEVIDLNNFGYLCWLGCDKIDYNLLNECNNNFEKIWSYHPTNKSTIIMRENNISAHRYLQSYLNTPTIEMVNIKKSSYMFSKNNRDVLPHEFKTILTYVNEKYHMKYNQIVVNWYENGDDYLPYHQDWTNEKEKEFYITTVTLCEHNGEREMYFINDENEKYVVTLKNGSIITIGGLTNSLYKHGIPQQSNIIGRRISLTFRYFEINDNNIKNYECIEYTSNV